MTKYARILIGLVLLSTACTKNEKETPGGFKFQVLKAGDGVPAKTQEVIVFDYVLKDSKDSVWSETYKQGMTQGIPIGDTSTMASENGMIQMFRMLSKGDSVKTTMPIKKFFQDVAGGMPPFKIDTTMNMSYIIKVHDIMSGEAFQQYRMTMFEKVRVSQISKDADAITKYLADKKINAQKDSSGIMYVIHTSKGGKKPTDQSCVEVNYRGMFMDNGQIFDQAPSVAFPLARVIPGWQRAVPLLGVGDSATFYIPSGLAYGPQGQQGSIPPNAVLIFDVALLKFSDSYDQATGTCK
ncbi:MAG: FKBP-type peptidyl-prolyl cis-trans isomerase [Chryseolinea sp.]